MAKLLVNESAGTREFDLVDAEAHIGRELDNSLRLADPSISRHHAVVRRTPMGYEVQDLQSSNGVLLNGSRVQTAPLQDGDRITLGQIQLTFLDPKPEADATMAVMATDHQAAPLGTMRMNADQMALIHGGGTPAEPEPVQPPAPPPPPPPPMPPPVPAPALVSEAAAPAPSAPPVAPPSSPVPTTPPPPKAPAFGEFTSPGTSGAPMTQKTIQKPDANPLVAALLTWFVLGIGHLVINGQQRKWIFTLVAGLIGTVLCCLPGIFIGILSVMDSYQTAERLQAGEAIPENEYSVPMLFKIVSFIDKEATCSKA